ncbi:YeeE/YedE thiosulfate transporter family protein [Draconibacterium sp.]|nr:YeeE/YedE thiosulfate transporter family protein [Draconibacterium sp.]
MDILLAIILGTAFGFALDQAQASNPQKIINMLRLKDFHLMKVILFAIGFSSLILFILLALNVIDAGHLSIKTSYFGVIIGGGVLGIGFAIGGYCPGTGLVAAGRGRKDALFFILGGLLGAFIYLLIFGLIQDTVLFNKIAGGAVSLVNTNPDKYLSFFKNIPALSLAGPIAVLFIGIAFLLPGVKEKS